MLHKLIKPLAVLCFAGISYMIGNRIYLYYTHTEAPIIKIEGISQDGFYKGSIDAKVVANNKYKIATIDALLDNKPFPGISSKINSRSFSHSFTIDSEQLEDGKHILQLHAIDASRQKNYSDTAITFNIDNKPLAASFVETNYRIDQGKTAHIQIQTNKQIKTITLKIFDKTFECLPENPASTLYECFIPIDCEEIPTQHEIIAEILDHVGHAAKLLANLEIVQFNFPKQKGFSVDSEKLVAEKSVSMSANVLSEAIERWAKESPKQKLWHGKFEIPMQVRRMTTPFGEIRVTPECGRYMHRGVDLVNIPRNVVWAAQNGKVIIKDRFAMTGNTVVIDHGLGVMTVYAHLDSFSEIEIGDMVKKGCPLGKVGMTGYANGYHLHWELRINGIAVDPLEWTDSVY